MGSLSYAGLSDCGPVRSHNEDRWYADAEQGLFLVADGMGGGPAGELAAEIVVSVLPKLLRQRLQKFSDYSAPDASRAVETAISELSERIWQKSQGEQGLEGMGSTVVVLLVRESRAIVAHVGDSRAYLLRDGELQLLTVDHSVLQNLMESGDILPDELDSHPARGKLTRFIGMEGNPLPETRFLQLQQGDRFLLCSDGLSGILTGAELHAQLSEEGSPQVIIRTLVTTAREEGARDNVTGIVVEPELLRIV